MLSVKADCSLSYSVTEIEPKGHVRVKSRMVEVWQKRRTIRVVNNEMDFLCLRINWSMHHPNLHSLSPHTTGPYRSIITIPTSFQTSISTEYRLALPKEPRASWDWQAIIRPLIFTALVPSLYPGGRHFSSSQRRPNEPDGIAYQLAMSVRPRRAGR